MSLELYLQRFDPSGDEVPKHPQVLPDLEHIAREVLRAAGKSEADLTSDGFSFSIEMPGGTATIHPTYGQFPVQELDTLTLQMIYAIARAGDMVIITEGGEYRAILTDPEQRSNMPEGWLHRDEPVPVCFSAEQLAFLLEGWFQVHAGYSRLAFADLQPSGERTWAPGTRPEGPAEFIYIETFANESAVTHQQKVYKRSRTIHKSDGPHRPENGIMMSEFWQVETPSGRVFLAYSYGGDYANWRDMLKDFAANEGRATAHIENFDTFVQDDGSRFLISTCKSNKVQAS